MKSKLALVLLSFSLCFFAFAEDLEKEKHWSDSDQGDSAHVGEVEDYYGDSKRFPSKMTPSSSSYKKPKQPTAKLPPGPSYGGEQYLEFNAESQVMNLHGKVGNSWGFSYFYDTYDYKDRDGIFKKTFQNDDSADSVQAGYFLLNYRNFISRSKLDYFIGVDLGFSYNTGKGKFSDDDTLSRTSFNLWVVPIDFLFGVKANMGRSVGLSLAAGPSVVTLLQNRSDRDEEDDDKDLNQVGYGYTAQASLDFSITQIFPSFGLNLRTESDLADLTMSLSVRMMNASGFKNKDIEISGTSVGLGFKFEYL